MIASQAHSIPQTRFLRVISAEQMKATKPIQFLFEIQPLHSCQPLRQPSGNSGTRPNLVWPVFEERSTQRLRWGYCVSVCVCGGLKAVTLATQCKLLVMLELLSTHAPATNLTTSQRAALWAVAMCHMWTMSRMIILHPLFTWRPSCGILHSASLVAESDAHGLFMFNLLAAIQDSSLIVPAGDWTGSIQPTPAQSSEMHVACLNFRFTILLFITIE